MNKSNKQQKMIFFGKILMMAIGAVIALISLIIIINYFSSIITPKNYCENQDNTDTPENMVQNVIRQFEIFRGVGDTIKIASCVSESFSTIEFLGVQYFDIIYIDFQEIIMQDEETFVARAMINRQYFHSGIGGGSYTYKLVPVQFTLKKFNGQWLITNYEDRSNNF